MAFSLNPGSMNWVPENELTGIPPMSVDRETAAAREAILRVELDSARELLRQQDELLAQIEAMPHSFAAVIAVEEDGLYLSARGQIIRVPSRPEMGLSRGDIVEVVEGNAAPLKLASIPITGRLATFVGYLGGVDDRGKVFLNGATTVVYLGSTYPNPGDEVELDPSGMVILRNLGQPKSAYRFESSVNVSWDAVGGLTEAKRRLAEVVRMDPDLAKRFNRKVPKGALLYGPPGCGKTMLGKALATAFTGPFFYIKGSEILNKYVGASEDRVRELFKDAKSSGERSVIFIDEADSILGRRGHSYAFNDSIVASFLTEMDGLEESKAFVLLATNRADALDPAITRDGRIDFKIEITRPDQMAVRAIAEGLLDKLPCWGAGPLAHCLAESVFTSPVAEIINGAMVVNMVDQAAALAMDREAASGSPAYIEEHDVRSAVIFIYQQNTNMMRTHV